MPAKDPVSQLVGSLNEKSSTVTTGARNCIIFGLVNYLAVVFVLRSLLSFCSNRGAWRLPIIPKRSATRDCVSASKLALYPPSYSTDMSCESSSNSEGFSSPSGKWIRLVQPAQVHEGNCVLRRAVSA